MPTVDIVIVTFNNPEVEQKCIAAVERYTEDYNLIIHNNYPQNEGLSTIWNKYLKETKADYVCLLNSDAYVSKNWLKEMLKAFRNIANVAVVGPSGNLLGATQGTYETEEESLRRKDQFREIPYCSGYCMLIKAGLGIYFPEEIPFYFNEIAWQHMVKDAGYKRVWALGAWVFHEGESTMKKSKNCDFFHYQGEERFRKWLSKYLNGRRNKW